VDAEHLALPGASHTRVRSDGRGTAVIVGASLAGLMTALTLSRAGVGVTLIERSDDTGRTGAALHVEQGLVERLTGHTTPAGQLLAAGVQSWFTVHAGLRAAVQADPCIRLHCDLAVEDAGQDDDAAWAVTSDCRTFRGDILVGADGHRSTVRRSVSATKPDATFAGYGIWLGVAPEEALPSGLHWPKDVAYFELRSDILLGYPLPSRDGATAKGMRQLGWAWYDRRRNELLRSSGCVAGHVVQHSLRPNAIPDATYRELTEEARQRWPAPWLDAVLDCVRRRAIIGTPIAEYLPDRLVNGRIALVGDAAHVPTPMTGQGFGASMIDAEALAEAVSHGLRGPAAARALQAYEEARLGSVRRLVRTGQEFSRSFAGSAA
jgi:2-polyprenyl-6-methoxyphenol hydroxylase-like FAD-dependent oxidoreductase